MGLLIYLLFFLFEWAYVLYIYIYIYTYIYILYIYIIALFTWRDDFNKELVVGRSLQKGLRLFHQVPLFLSVVQFLSMFKRSTVFLKIQIHFLWFHVLRTRLSLWFSYIISEVPSYIFIICCLKLMQEDLSEWVCFYLCMNRSTCKMLFDKYFAHLES